MIGKKVFLLIEPVWNRNAPASAMLIGFAQLLIEPVWNRNGIDSSEGR